MAALHIFLSHPSSPNRWIIALVRSIALSFFLPWYSFTMSYMASATVSVVTAMGHLLDRSSSASAARTA